MKQIRRILSNILDSWKRYNEMPFMTFLTFVFVFIYIWTVIDSVPLRNPATLIVFTVLFNLHLFLHWVSITWMDRKWNIYLYLGIQSALIFVVVSLAMSLGPLFGLYLGMIGESVGILSKPRKIAAGVSFFLLLSFANYLMITNGAAAPWWLLAMGPMTVFVIIYVVLYSRQADAREKAQKLLVELTEANRRLSEYAGQVEDLTLANERQRMARELHDTLAQGLAGLILQLEAADSHLEGNRPDRARAIVEQAMARARTTLADSRQAIDNLRSGECRPEDLAEAIRAEAVHLQSMAGIPCALEMELPENLTETQRDLVFRTVAEGLGNIARHARARQAAVSIRSADGILEVAVQDDGAGFDPAAVPSGHYGLLGLRERARGAGGSVEVVSRPADGTVLRLSLPIPRDPGPG